MALTREQMAQRIAKEIQNGFYVNLGIGIPTLVANYIPTNITVTLQSENGLLGIGRFPYQGEEDPDLINAGKETITTNIGASFFSSAESFAMIRAGKVDLSILGAMEVSETGDIANWIIPGKVVKGMGGAMDLLTGTKRVIVVMQHKSKDGKSKILKKCTLPLSASNAVHLIVTELAVLEITEKGMHLLERAPGVSIDEIVKATECGLIIGDNVPEMKI